MQEFSGTGDTFDEALLDAIRQAINLGNYPDKGLQYTLKEVKGQYVGIAAKNIVYVTIIGS